MSQVRGREQVAEDPFWDEPEHAEMSSFHRTGTAPAIRGRVRQRRNEGDTRKRSRGGGGGGGRGGYQSPGDPNFSRRGRGRAERDGVGKRSSGLPHTRKQGGIKYLTQEDIKRLCGSDSSELVRCITENEGGFLAAFSHQPNCGYPLVLKCLIKLLYLLVKSKDRHLASRIEHTYLVIVVELQSSSTVWKY